MSARATGLVSLRPMERVPPVPVAARAAFQKLLKMQSSFGDDHVHFGHDALMVARAEKRAAVRDCQTDVQEGRAWTPFLQHCSSSDGSADKFLAKCLRQNLQGFPDFLFDDSNKLIHGHEVLEEAAMYIQKLQGLIPSIACRVKVHFSFCELTCAKKIMPPWIPVHVHAFWQKNQARCLGEARQPAKSS